MQLKAVFFDLDGTLLDTAQDLGRALNDLLVEERKAPIAIKNLRHVVSDGALGLLKPGFGINQEDEQYDTLREKLLRYYLEDLSSNTKAFEGIHELIEELAEHNIQWGIATNKPWAYTEPLMKAFNFAQPPICVLCPEHVTEKKPHAESLLKACDYAKCLPENIVYIGDHIRDIECGKNAGAKTIAAGYGYIKPKKRYLDWPADHHVEHASQIWPLLKKVYQIPELDYED